MKTRSAGAARVAHPVQVIVFDMQFCYQCGAQAETDDQFCGNCGIAQPVPSSASQGRDEFSELSAQSSFIAAPIWTEQPRAVERTTADPLAYGGEHLPATSSGDDSKSMAESLTPPAATPLPDFNYVSHTFESLNVTPTTTPSSLLAKKESAEDTGFEVLPAEAPVAAPEPPVSSVSPAEVDSPSGQPSEGGTGSIKPSSELHSADAEISVEPLSHEPAGEPGVSASEGVAAEAISTPFTHPAPEVVATTAPPPAVEAEEIDPELQATIITRPPVRKQSAPVPPPAPVPAADNTGSHNFGAERAAQDAVSRPVNRVSGSGPRTGGTMNSNRTAPKNLETGTLLNSRYEISRRIGGGGMGAVYLAKDRNLGDAPRAVKEMIQSQMDEAQQEKAINDFKRESLLLTSLEHNSIPTIYDYFYDEIAGRFYLVMRYISGGDLLTRLRNAPGGRIDEKTVTAWGVEVADVLEYLHTRRPPIIYRDLKPANLMIDGNSGRIMLIDFGIARWVGAPEKGVTAVGTMGYAPPELFSGKVEARSDVYSLGATMFHLLTGSDPQDNPLLIFDFTKHQRPRQINPALSLEIERILLRAVEYKPEDRFASAAELRDALAQHLKNLSAGSVSFGSSVTAPDHPSGQTSATEMVFCGFCGGRIAGNDLFCAYCGARQPLAGASAALARPSRSTAKLVVASTSELNAPSFALQKESNMVGRSDPNSNIFPEVDLSRFDPNTKISR
ncbi:MAG TPA: protein kinase, partial [Pyrinomonadaceae bacterium]|nr:protein kinase [Pyrinomonadaceae bacterium]